jgi:hypothetical protein
MRKFHLQKRAILIPRSCAKAATHFRHRPLTRYPATPRQPAAFFVKTRASTFPANSTFHSHDFSRNFAV